MNMKYFLHSSVLAWLLVLSGCGTVRVLDRPYSETEVQVLGRLGIDKESLTQTERKTTQITVDANLQEYMAMRIFDVDLEDYEPGVHIRFVAHHLYNIGAIGGEYVRCDIRQVSEKRTRVFVDYSDRGFGCLCIPVVFINPGIRRERRILEYLLDQEPKEKPANQQVHRTQ